MQIPIENIKIRFFENIYKEAVSKASKFENYSLGRGRKVLSDVQECNKYLVLYGGHHFHKLYEAFRSTLFEYIDGKNVEIIDWGSGIALASSVLVDYLIEKKIEANIVKITLVEPSINATKIGVECLCKMFQNDNSAKQIVEIINKNIDNLTVQDFDSDSESIKIHLFSNIIDMEVFDLKHLYSLIVGTFRNLNRLICTSPNNTTMGRLDEFHRLFADSFPLTSGKYVQGSLQREIFKMKTWSYENTYIGRCEKQFTINI